MCISPSPETVEVSLFQTLCCRSGWLGGWVWFYLLLFSVSTSVPGKRENTVTSSPSSEWNIAKSRDLSPFVHQLDLGCFLVIFEHCILHYMNYLGMLIPYYLINNQVLNWMSRNECNNLFVVKHCWLSVVVCPKWNVSHIHHDRLVTRRRSLGQNSVHRSPHCSCGVSRVKWIHHNCYKKEPVWTNHSLSCGYTRVSITS